MIEETLTAENIKLYAHHLATECYLNHCVEVLKTTNAKDAEPEVLKNGMHKWTLKAGKPEIAQNIYHIIKWKPYIKYTGFIEFCSEKIDSAAGMVTRKEDWKNKYGTIV